MNPTLGDLDQADRGAVVVGLGVALAVSVLSSYVYRASTPSTPSARSPVSVRSA